MTRLLSTIRWDIQLQFRNGFYYATAFVLAIWAALALQIRALDLDLSWLLPVLVLNELVIVTFYFMSGLVLLEKGEGTLEAQVVTPLRTGEYLAAKVITLTLLALVPSVVVVTLLAGIALASALLVLAGFLAVARYHAINEFLLPSIPYVAALLVPLVPYVSGWESWINYLHPIYAALLLMRAAFAPIAPWQTIYSALYLGLWIALAYVASQRAFDRFVVGRGGR
jgi:fluoroquinolone transport system permease protein